jgi:hypothetical protein
MKKWLAAGLMSCSLAAPHLLAQTPPAPAVAAPADSAEYRPADEGWSIRTAKGWKVKSATSTSPTDPDALFARTASHEFESKNQLLEVYVMCLKRKEALSSVEKANLCDAFAAQAEKKAGRMSRKTPDPKALGFAESALVEDWAVDLKPIGDVPIRQEVRVVVNDHAAYMLFATGAPEVSDEARAIVGSFRLHAKENPRPVSTGVTAKPPAVTDAANRPARPAPGPAAAPPTLPALFDSLGYTAKNVGTEAEPIYELRFHRDGWNYVLKCQYSKDRQVLWVFSNVGAEGVDPSRLSPSAVLALLGENDKDRLVYFSFNADRKQFCLNTAVDPKQLSAQVLRERIDLLTAVIKETAPAWGALATDRK